MQRTLAIVMVPGLLFLALCLFALEPGREGEAVDSSPPATFERGDTAIIMADRTALKRGEKTLALLDKGTELHVRQVRKPWIGGQVIFGGQTVSGWVHQRELKRQAPAADHQATNRAGTSDAQPASERTDAAGEGTVDEMDDAADDGPPESIAKKFARLIADERALKGSNRSGTGAGADPGTSQSTLPTQPDATSENAEQRDLGAPQTGHIPKSTRDGLVSALPIRVARTASDLVALDPKQVIGQLTITGDQFTNRSLQHLAGLGILSMSIEAVHVGDLGLFHVAKVKGLKELRLWTPGVTDDGLQPLAEMDSLELLDLEGTSVRGTGMIDTGGFPKLKQLTLSPQTEDEDLALVASVPSLVELDLRTCRQLTNACLNLLAKYDQLKVLWLPPQIDKQESRQLLPNCHVRW